VQDIAVVRDFGEGEFTTTGNSLDVAIHGKGWFVIDTPDRQAYTRNGHFSLNQEGQLVTSGGHPVLSATGAPIQFGPDETGIKISGDGTISTTAGVKGRLDVVTFEDEKELDKASETLFITDAVPTKAENVKIAQGMIEASNVQPVVQITNMIWAMRSYQAAHEVVNGSDRTLREAIDTITDQQA
jgi:flagellar basal-body rod protein FlgF